MKPNVKVLLIGIVTLIVLAIYSLADFKLGSDSLEIRKADFQSLYTPDATEDLNLQASDTILPGIAQTDSAALIVAIPDTARNILFFGDSMLEGLCRRFIDYTDHNGHQLHTVVWYSSSTDLWANTDTLQYFMRKYDPNYIVVCLGGNELFVRDVDKRKKNIEKIVAKIGDIPFVWVSPPNWKEDTGINDAIISVVGRDRYFDSRTLQLERGKDHAHPTFPAAAIWMDTIARWISSPACRNPLLMELPDKEVPSRNVVMLQPYNK